MSDEWKPLTVWNIGSIGAKRLMMFIDYGKSSHQMYRPNWAVAQELDVEVRERFARETRERIARIEAEAKKHRGRNVIGKVANQALLQSFE